MFETKTKLYKIKKNLKKNQNIIFLLFFCSVLVFLDQFIKNLVTTNLNLHESFIFIRKIAKITYIKNYGAAFSMFSYKTNFLIIFTILVLSVFIVYIFKKRVKDKIYILTVILMVSGEIGNLIDRISKGYVVDYINLEFWPFEKFAIFNFADCLVVFGCILFLIKFIKNELVIGSIKKKKL